jgi:hypothetical protein
MPNDTPTYDRCVFCAPDGNLMSRVFFDELGREQKARKT